MNSTRQRKKILHVISSLKTGGAERILVWLSHRLKPWYEQKVLYIHDGPMRAELERAQIATQQIRYSGFIRQFDAEHRTYKPDVIVSSLWAANMLTRTVGKYYTTPIINCMHAHPKHEGIWRNLIDRLLPCSAHCVIAVSPSIAHTLTKKLAIAPTKIRVIPNGIDRTALDRASSKECDKTIGYYIQKKKRERCFFIGCIGRLVPVKNHMLLLKSFAQLLTTHSHCVLFIIGSGPQEKALRAYRDKLGLQEHVYFVTNQQSFPYYRHLDCFVQPSESEGISMALLESLYFGVPAIVTGNNKKHDVITHNLHGLVIPHQNHTALTQAMMDIIENYHLRRRLSVHGKTLIDKRYTAQKMVEHYKHCIEELL